MYLVYTLYVQVLNKYVHQHVRKYKMYVTYYVYIHGVNQKSDLFYICVSVRWLYRVFYLVHSVPYHEHAKPFSDWSISLRHAIRTCLYSLHEVLYRDYASVQESAVLYMQCSYAYIHPKNACGRWSPFVWHFVKNAYIRVCQRLYMLKVKPSMVASPRKTTGVLFQW